MDSGRPPGHGSGPAHRRRHGVANEDALLALGEGAAGSADAGTPIPNGEALRALGEEIDRSHPVRRRRHRAAWVLGSLGALLLLVVLGVGGYAWYLNHEIHRVDVRGLTGAPTRGVFQNTENILMVGSTSRCALATQNAAYGYCQGTASSAPVNGINSDVVMILHLDANAHRVSILSIPRDLFVPNARAEGANKIDAALVEGPSQLVRAIQDDFGIPIQHYVELNFDSFANVVDALGGINMYFPEAVFDQESGLKVLTPGCVHLDGFHALQVVRARHLQYKGPGITTPYPSYWPLEAQSDLARIRRDHEFLRVLAAAVAKKGLGNPLTDQQILAGVAPQLEVDSGLSASAMVNLVLNFHTVNAGTAPQLTVPVTVDQFGSYIYKGGDYGDIEFPIQPTDQQVVDKFLGVGPGIDTMGGGPLPVPSSVSVSVQNGTGVTNQAADTAGALKALGFHIAGIGDTPPVAQESETVVAYSSKNPAGMADAQAVAHALSGAVILANDPAMLTNGAPVTVVTGSDFSVDPPPATPTTAGAGAATTTAGAAASTTTAPPTTTTTSSGAFSAPTAAKEALAPWDPRSCTASGGEGP